MNNITLNQKKIFRFHELKQEPALLVGVLFVFALLVFFILYPLFATLNLSLSTESGKGIDVYRDILTRSQYTSALRNSILLGITVATTSTIIGFLFAFALTKSRIRGKKVFRALSILPLISPPFMFALSVILLFGKNGLITAHLFGLDTRGIYGFVGLIVVQTVGLFPLAYLTLVGILQGINPDLETCAMSLGANKKKSFWTVTLPLALPGLFASWLLVFVGSLTDFGNPMVIGGNFNVLSVQAYLEFTGMGNLPRGAALAILLLVPTLGVFALQKYIMKNKSYTTITGKSSRKASSLTSKAADKALFTICLLVSLFILLLYFTIISGSFVKLWGLDWSLTFEHFVYSFDVGFDAMKSTLILALIATPLTAILGTVISFFVVRKNFTGKYVLEFLALLNYAIPGTAVGIGYILAFNQAPFRLSGTAFILITAYIFRNLPIGVEGCVVALKQISSDIEESSVNLGATSALTFRKVTLPLIRPSFFAASTFAFVRCMTAISAIIFLVSARWNHLTVLILAQTEILRLGAASVLSFTLIIIVMGFIFLSIKLLKVDQSQIFGKVN